MKVFLALPYMRELSPQTAGTVSAFRLEAASQEIELEEFHWKGDSLIAHARNICIAAFLKSNADQIFFLDSDVGCGVGIFSRMMTHRVDIVAGIYRIKADEERYPVRFKEGVPKRIPDPRTGLLAAEGVPFGFCRISREMIQFMVEQHPDDWYTTHLMPDTRVPVLFNTELKDHQFWGEDFYFCNRLRATGHMIWVDPDIPLTHIGDKPYPGHFGRWLRERGELIDPPFCPVLTTAPVGDAV